MDCAPQLIKYSLCIQIDACTVTLQLGEIQFETLWESDLNPGWKIRASLTTKAHHSASWVKVWKVFGWLPCCLKSANQTKTFSRGGAWVGWWFKDLNRIILMMCQRSIYLPVFWYFTAWWGDWPAKDEDKKKWEKTEICNLFPPGSCIETSARYPVAWLEACLDIYFWNGCEKLNRWDIKKIPYKVRWSLVLVWAARPPPVWSRGGSGRPRGLEVEDLQSCSPSPGQ